MPETDYVSNQKKEKSTNARFLSFWGQKIKLSHYSKEKHQFKVSRALGKLSEMTFSLPDFIAEKSCQQTKTVLRNYLYSF